MSSIQSSYQHQATGGTIDDDTTARGTMVKSSCQMIWPTAIQGIHTSYLMSTFPISNSQNHYLNISYSSYSSDRLNHEWLQHSLLGVYSSTNWPLFTNSQNSILNRVLKLNPLNQKSLSLWLFSNGVCLFIATRIIFIKHQSWRSSSNPQQKWEEVEMYLHSMHRDVII